MRAPLVREAFPDPLDPYAPSDHPRDAPTHSVVKRELVLSDDVSGFPFPISGGTVDFASDPVVSIIGVESMTGATTGGATGVASLEPPMRSRILPSPPVNGVICGASSTWVIATSGVTSIGVGVSVDGAGAAPRKVPEISGAGAPDHAMRSGVTHAQMAGLSGTVRSVREGVVRSEVAGVAPSMTMLVSGIESKEISPPDQNLKRREMDLLVPYRFRERYLSEVQDGGSHAHHSLLFYQTQRGQR